MTTAPPEVDLSKVPPLLLDVARLHGVGLAHLFPVGAEKTPKGQGQWRHGGTDYATTPMPLQEWAERIGTGKPQGVAVIANRDTGVVIIDAEKPGMNETMVQAGLQSLPERCQIVTRNGGRHAYLIVEGDYPEHPKNLAEHPPPEGSTNPVLLCEVRLAPNYAVIVGPGRPPLRPDFAPARISRAEYDRVTDMIRQAGTYTRTAPERKPYNSDGSGGGTGSIVTEAVATGSLSPLAVLPDGWRIAGSAVGGKVFVVRPGTESDTSGNVVDGVVCIHSTSVEWAPQPEPGKSAAPISAAECLALSRHGGDYFAAMAAVEKIAADYAEDGITPPLYWSDALDVLAEIHAQRLQAKADYRARKEAEELAALTEDPSASATDQPEPDDTPPAGTSEPEPEPVSRRGVHDTFAYWFGDHFDHQYLDVVLAVALTGLALDGDPCWLQVVGGAGVGKTEVTSALSDAGCTVVSTISGEAALLSGTSAKSKAKNATGGLLRQLGARGTLVIKDFTTILSLHREKRAEIMAALREVYDGNWSRNLGVDGGQTLTWSGRLTVISCVTGVYDDHHAVIAAMGDRFLLLRLDSDDKRMRRHATRRAIANVGGEDVMRAKLGQAVAGFLANVRVPEDLAPDDTTADRIVALADLVSRARSQVSRDFKGDPEYAHSAEMPTRIAKQLTQLWRGAQACGLTDAESLAAVQRVAADSIPPDRRQAIEAVSRGNGPTTTEIARVTGMSRRKADRVLQELALLRMVRQDSIKVGDHTRWTWHPAEDHEQDMRDGWLAALARGYGKANTCSLCAEMSDGVAGDDSEGGGGNVGQTTEHDQAPDFLTNPPLSTHLPVPDDISAQGSDADRAGDRWPFK